MTAKGLIEIVKISPGMLTSYMPRGKGTRISGNRVPEDHQVMVVGQATGGAWRLSKASARDLDCLDAALRQQGGGRVRITDALREPTIQERARQKYEAWVNAGRPEYGSPRFDRTRMKAAYVARPGESNHGWGGAIDIDVGALRFPGVRQGSSEALAIFWEIAESSGWTPVISYPNVGQSEAWHFDHFGGLRSVYDLFNARRSELPRYRRPYSQTATVGAILANTMPRSTSNPQQRFVQARLLAGGFWCGIPDGIIGPKTVEALKEATGIRTLTRRTPISQILGLITQAEIGLETIEAC